MPTLDAITRFGVVNNPIPVKSDTEPDVKKAAEMQDVVVEIARGFMAAMDRVYKNVDLSETGRAARMKEVGREWIEKFDPIENNVLPKLRRVMALTLKEVGNTVGRPSADVAATLREQEARQAVRDMTNAQRHQALTRAVEEGDAAAFGVFIHAPSVAPLVDPTTLEAAKKAWIEKRNPDAARRHEAAKDAHDALTENVENAKQAIGEAAGLEEYSIASQMQDADARRRAMEAGGVASRAERTKVGASFA